MIHSPEERAQLRYRGAVDPKVADAYESALAHTEGALSAVRELWPFYADHFRPGRNLDELAYDLARAYRTLAECEEDLYGEAESSDESLGF